MDVRIISSLTVELLNHDAFSTPLSKVDTGGYLSGGMASSLPCQRELMGILAFDTP